MANLGILRKYANMSHPESLPASVLLSHSPTTLTIFDSYPKAIFHFLVLPRVVAPLTVSNLTNLRALLKQDREHAKRVLVNLSEEAARVRALVEAEMVKRYGFKWAVWTGFHAVPSMEHVHLHIISSDLVAAPLKTKKHYNSFHPTRGFFLHLADVLAWFDAAPSEFAAMSALKASDYEPLLKADLSCWRCGKDLKNMPALKAHMQGEWDREGRSQKAETEAKMDES